jgi:tetratricopeptide (TPR) repeat protein
MGPAITVPGYMGEPVLTNIGLASFITAFESIIKRAKAQGVTVINATEGGARIPEARQMALVKALRDYRALKNQEIDKTEVKALCSSLRKDWVEDINKAERIGGEEIDLLQEIIDTCIKALETNRKLSHLSAKKQRAEVEKLLKENEELSNKANALCDKNSLIKLYIYGASRQIQSKELKVNGKKEHILSNRKDMHTRLRRNELILMSAKTAAEELLICYKKTMDVFKEFKETGNWEVFYEKTDYQPSIKDAQTYLDKGNWARPYLDCLAIIESKAGDPSIREQTAEIFDQCLYLKILSISTAQEEMALREKEIEYRELVFMAQSEGREQKDFKKALDLLKEAITIFPDRPDALWGLATGLHYSGESKQSLEAYDKLVKKFPENKRFEFERNLVLIEDDVQRGAYEMSVFLINNEDYQYFWRNLGELFSRMGNIKKAVEAYKIYLQKFPIDDLAKTKLKELEECL